VSDDQDDFNRADEVDDDDYDDDVDDGDDPNRVREVAPTAQSVLEYLVTSIVEVPEEVEIEIDEGGRTPLLEVRVADGDMGRVIGRRGRVATAIRTVVRAAAAKDGDDVGVEFVD